MGVLSLQDNELAGRLNLSHEQRRLLAEREEARQRVIHSFDGGNAPAKNSIEAQRGYEDLMARQREAEAHLWEVLSPDQIEEWQRLADSVPRQIQKPR